MRPMAASRGSIKPRVIAIKRFSIVKVDRRYGRAIERGIAAEVVSDVAAVAEWRRKKKTDGSSPTVANDQGRLLRHPPTCRMGEGTTATIGPSSMRDVLIVLHIHAEHLWS